MQTPTHAACLPGADAEPTAVDSVLHAMMTVGRLLRQRISGDGLDPGTLWLLKGLAQHGPMRVTELATLAGLDASTVSRHVQQLHRTGLLERSQDPADGRAQRVALSEQGRQVLHAGLVRRRELLSRSLEGWDAEDIEVFDRLLGRFVSNIENDSNVETNGVVGTTTELEHA